MKKKAFFLDRDGVLSQENGYVTTLEEFTIFPYARESIEQIHKCGFLAIVVTNQSAIGRGLLREDDLKTMNEELVSQTGVDGVFYCPHLESEHCQCRKPGIGLIQQAMKEYEIQLKGSYLIGDRGSDILLGKQLGITTVLVESGYGSQQLEPEVVPDFIYTDLLDAVNSILK
ncbi:MAG: HAD family hydrolase [Lachnospiraceae bacterium]